MSKKMIRLQFEGVPEEDGRVRFGAFLSELQSLSAVLKEATRAVGGETGKGRTYYRIAELGFSSPYTIVLEPVTPKGATDSTAQAVGNLFHTVRALSGGEAIPEDLDPELLESIKGLVSGLGRQFTSPVLSFDGEEVELGAKLGSVVDVRVVSSAKCLGTLEGCLEEINLHGDLTRFRIYPRTGPSRVSCMFPPGLREEAKNGLDRFVRVTGVLHYKARAHFPHSVDVDAIEVLPPDNEVEHLLDLRGIAPDVGDSTPSEDIVRKLRNEWDGS